MKINDAIVAARQQALASDAFAEQTAISAVGNICKVYATPKQLAGRTVDIEIKVYDVSGARPRRLDRKDWA